MSTARPNPARDELARYLLTGTYLTCSWIFIYTSGIHALFAGASEYEDLDVRKVAKLLTPVVAEQGLCSLIVSKGRSFHVLQQMHNLSGSRSCSRKRKTPPTHSSLSSWVLESAV